MSNYVQVIPNSETSHLSIGSFCGEIRIKQNYDEPAQVSPIGNNIKLSTENNKYLHKKSS